CHWSTQRGSTQANAEISAVLKVATIAIQLVGVHRGRIMTKTILELFYLPFQVAGLVVVVPTQPINEAKPLHHAHRYLGAKLNRGGELAAHHRPYMRLADAD